MDRIFIKGIELYGYHGVMNEEEILGQRFIVDIIAGCDLREAGKSDDLTKTVSYADIYDIIERINREKRYALIEAFAEEIAGEILKIERIRNIIVRVNKPGAPVKGIFSEIGVEIERWKEK